MQTLKRWRWLLNPLRFLISGGLLAYLVWRADPVSIWQAWRGVNLWLVALATLVQFAGVALSAAKWNVILGGHQQQQPYPWTLGVYLVGQFANNFLPTSVGGDAVRVVQLGKRIESYSQASASVFLDRLTGFLALSLIAGLALLLTASGLGGAHFSTSMPLMVLAGGFALAAVSAVVASLLAPRLLRLFGGQRLPQAIREPLEKIATALAAYTPTGWRFGAVLGLSLLFHSIWIGSHVICGIALGIQAPLIAYMLMVPLTDMVGLAPIFVNNIGARDLIFSLYLSQAGVPAATAIALAFLIFTVRLCISALGGLVTLLGGADLRVSTSDRVTG